MVMIVINIALLSTRIIILMMKELCYMALFDVPFSIVDQGSRFTEKTVKIDHFPKKNSS